MEIFSKNRFTGDEEFELGQVIDLPDNPTPVSSKMKDPIEAINFNSVRSLGRVVKVSASSYKVVPFKTNSQKLIARMLVRANKVAINYSEELDDDNTLVNKTEDALWNVTTKSGTVYIQRM